MGRVKLASGALSGTFPAILLPIQLLRCEVHQKGLIHMMKIFS